MFITRRHCDLLTLITRIRNVTSKQRNQTLHRAPDLYRPYKEILLKSSENIASATIGDLPSFFSILFSFINAKCSVSFTQTVTADWSYLFIYLLFSKSCFTVVLIIIIVHHSGRFLICFNCQYFDTFKLYSESITMVCHESILIKKCFYIAKTWQSVVRLNKWMDTFVRVMIASSIQGISRDFNKFWSVV